MSAPLLTPEIRDGMYARKQLQSGARLVAWSHGRRFQVALEMGAGAGGQRVLDYGCGDGSFLAMLLHSGVTPREAVGAEIAQDLVEDCTRRLSATGFALSPCRTSISARAARST